MDDLGGKPLFSETSKWHFKSGILPVTTRFFFLKEGFIWWHSKLTPDQCGGGYQYIFKIFVCCNFFENAHAPLKMFKFVGRLSQHLLYFHPFETYIFEIWLPLMELKDDGKTARKHQWSNPWGLFSGFLFSSKYCWWFRHPEKTTWDV